MKDRNYIKQIVHYFLCHEFSRETISRIHRRLLQEEDRSMLDEALREAWDERMDAADIPMEETSRELHRLESRLYPRKSSKRQHSWIYRTGIAAIYILPLLMLSLSAYLYHQSSKDTSQKLELVEHTVPVGKQEEILLPDGSRVWLNACSFLVYPSSFKGECREVYLAGEGYFEIEKDEAKPFVVKTQALDVEVLGTRFDLSAYPHSGKTIATLEQGAVRVALKNVSASTFRLSPDEQLVYDAETGETRIRQVISASYSDWRDGGLMFDDYSLREIIPVLERTYNVTIHLKTSIHNKHRLSVHFDKNEPIGNVLSLLRELIPGMNFHEEDDDIYIE